jgi:DnaK suppressor protein
MTKTKLNEFRNVLEQKQTELGSGSRSRDVLAIESSSDEMDRIQRASERESAIDKLERSSRRMGEVREALRRLDEGSFGICAGCERQIDPRRLAAVPWASSCVACQEAEERELKSSASEADTSFAMAD